MVGKGVGEEYPSIAQGRALRGKYGLRRGSTSKQHACYTPTLNKRQALFTKSYLTHEPLGGGHKVAPLYVL